MHALNYPPHVTLATFSDELDEARLRELGRTVFANQPAIRLTFQAVRFFPTSPLILWAEPVLSPELIRLHATIHRGALGSASRPVYRPGTWIAHSTLAFAVREDRRAQAMSYSERRIRPFEVLFDFGDVTFFHPVRVIEQWALSTIP